MRNPKRPHGKRKLLTDNLPTLLPHVLRYRDATAKSKLFRFCNVRALPFTFDAQRLWKIACDKRLVGFINFVVILLLVWQLISIVRLKGDSNMMVKVLSHMKSDDLPYPLNIAKLAMQPHAFVMSKASSANSSAPKLWPGYAEIRSATFRSRYPSSSISGSGTFDGIYVLTNSRCEQQWELFQQLANNFSLSYVRWPQLDSRQVQLSNPPLPLSTLVSKQIAGNNRAVLSILKRQIAYLDSHRRIWKNVIQTGRQRVLVTDDTLFPKPRLLRSLPSTMTNIDQESVARQTPWHFIFLRRQVQGIQMKRKSHRRRREPMWTVNPKYKHDVVIANISHGVGSYVLSLQGAKFLLSHVKRYRVPLDVEIGLLQKEQSAKFMALSACNNDDLRPFCPEIIRDISNSRGSGTFDCVWRRLQETQTADGFDSMLENVPR